MGFFNYQLIQCVSDSHKIIESNQMCFDFLNKLVQKLGKKPDLRFAEVLEVTTLFCLM